MHIFKNAYSKFNFIKNLAFCIIALCFLMACEKKLIPETSTPIAVSPGIVIKNIIPKGTEKYLHGSSDIIFDQEKVNTYNIILRYEDLGLLDSNPAKEEYVEAALVFNGDTISPIGIRYKGSIGAYAGCLSNPDWGNPSGYKTCTKLSIQLKLNWKDRKEKFYDLNKLQFHSQNYDKAQLRERMGYWLFSQMGVAAPRAVHARVLINGNYSGLYGLVEEVDNRFVDYNFPTGKGNVYKEIWPGQATSRQAFINALKTNESPNTNVELMSTFSEDVSEASPILAKNIVSKFMDINTTMAYIAVDRAIRHDDGPFHWYCDKSGNNCSNHNYYWFEDQKNQKMTLIPWDLDGAFEHIIRTGNNVTVVTDKWGETSNDCKAFFYGNTILQQKSAGCDKLTSTWTMYKDEYAAAKTKLQTTVLTETKALTQFDIWTKQIAPYIVEADNHFNISQGNQTPKATPKYTWDAAINTLRAQVEAAGKK
jgi:CotH kinase protein